MSTDSGKADQSQPERSPGKPPGIDLSPLVDLCHHRWTIPLVTALGRQGARLVVLAGELGVAPQTLRRTIAAATERGWVERNPGYGHPLRPEYRLTDAGLAIGADCRSLFADLGEPDRALVARKWTLPVLAAVAVGAERFSEIAAALPNATPRALASALDDLAGSGWLLRRLVDGRPPRPEYRVAPDVQGLAGQVLELAGTASAAGTAAETARRG